MTNKYKMFLLAYFFWLCLINSVLAYPMNQHKDSDFQSGIWSSLADYPDLTRGLTDAEVRDTLKDLTMDDLKNLDHLIMEHINEREEQNRAGLRAQRKNFRAVSPKVDDGCKEEKENDCDEPKQSTHSKPPTCPTTKRCMKTTTCGTKSPSRTTSKPECVPKTTCGSMDIFAKCPKVTGRRKKSKEDNKWQSDDFQGQARKRMEIGKKIMQELDLSKDAPVRGSAGNERIGGENIHSLNDQGEPLDEAFHLDNPKGSRLAEPAQLHDNLANRKPQPLANSDQGQHATFEGEHKSHLEQSSHKVQRETKLNVNHEGNLGREQEANLKQSPKASLQQENLDNFDQELWANADPAHWDNLEQTDSDRMKLANWASLNPASLANIEDANWDLSNWATEEQGQRPQFVQEQSHIELDKHANLQPAQEQQVKFHMENNNHNFKQDNHAQLQQGNLGTSQHENRAQLQQGNLGTSQHENRAQLQQGNLGTSEHENRANQQLQNQNSFDQTHQNRLVRDYHQADLNRDLAQHQDRELRSEVNLHPGGQPISRKRNVEQQSQASIPQREQQSDVNYHPKQWSSNQPLTKQESQAFIPHREQQSDANYHPKQWSSSQPLKNQEKVNNVEGEHAPLERYERHQLSRKRNAKQESQANMPQGVAHREQRSEIKYHPRTEQWQSNQAKLNKDEGNTYERNQLHQKRNAKIERPSEKRRAAVKEKEQIVAKNNEPQPVKADLTNFDVDRFLAISARDPPLYLNSMQNDRIQRENKRRLNKDRSLSESLNLDKLTSAKEATLAGESDWAADNNKRGKRENRSTDDAPENSRETYLKKLMDSFPRDQGSQINANVALKDSPFGHERMKRS